MDDGRHCGRCATPLPPNAPEGLCPRCVLGVAFEHEPQSTNARGRRKVDDRQLLFAVLAVQLRRVKPVQLLDIAGAWATDPSRSLPDRLVEAGVLSPKDRVFIDDVVDRAIEAAEGDVEASLASFGGDEEVHASFCGSILRSAPGEVVPVSRGGTPIDAAPLEPVRAVYETPGRYRAVGEYSRGGMGRILLVHDAHLGREIALKELLLPAAESPDGAPTPVQEAMPMMARFLQEARITGRLEHPGIVPVYELGCRRDGTLYYTMKLVRGQTMAQALRDAGTLERRLALLPHFVDLCQAVAYAHSRGVIHRDLKPANVMIGQFGETVVIDWGLAKAMDREDIYAEDMERTVRMLRAGDDARDTVYGSTLGTPSYMPPEQAEGRIDEVDERSDVYALGAVAYEILTGRPPFAGATLHEFLRRVLYDEPVPVRKLEPGAPPELVAVCERAMRKAPSERYPAARALATDIQRFIDHERELRIAAELARAEAERARELAQRERSEALHEKQEAERQLGKVLAAVSRWFRRDSRRFLAESGSSSISSSSNWLRSSPDWRRLLPKPVRHGLEAARHFLLDPAFKGNRRTQALLLASGWHLRSVVWVLRALGCDPNARIDGQDTLLMVAAQSDDPKMARLLLEIGANPDLADANGTTALMVATHCWATDAARVLLEAGADVHRANALGQTAMDLAAYLSQGELVEMLKQAGAHGVNLTEVHVPWWRAQELEETRAEPVRGDTDSNHPETRSLSGRVVDRDGNGIAGARVYAGARATESLIYLYEYHATPALAGSVAADARTDAEGAFTIPQLSPRAETVYAWHPEYSLNVVSVAEAGAIVLQKAGSVQGFLRTTFGIYPPYRLHLRHLDCACLGYPCFLIEPPGTFVIPGLTPGRFEVEARWGVGPIRGVSRQVAIAPGKVAEIELSTFDGTAVVRGKVSADEPERRRATLRLEVDDGTGRQFFQSLADDDGSFRFDHLPAGHARLSAGSSTRSYLRLTWTDPLEFALPDKATVRKNIDIRVSGS